jgi:hypothetical protein
LAEHVIGAERRGKTRARRTNSEESIAHYGATNYLALMSTISVADLKKKSA